MSTYKNQWCECGQPAKHRKMSHYICEFCFWCETSGFLGGEIEAGIRANRNPKPIVPRIPEWEEIRQAVIDLHGNTKFWAQRNSTKEKFNDLFRGQRKEPLSNLCNTEIT